MILCDLWVYGGLHPSKLLMDMFYTKQPELNIQKCVMTNEHTMLIIYT